MEYTKQARTIAANFLEVMVHEVDRLLKEDPSYSHYFPKVMSRTDKKARSIDGFLSVLAPEEVFDWGESIRSRRHPNRIFMPEQIGIPISLKVWTALTVANTQDNINEPMLPRLATFEQVSALWLKVAKMYRDGKLDDQLVTESKLYA